MIHIKLHINECLQVNFTGIVEWSNGSKVWYKEEKFHRDNGPAIEWDNGFREWWLEGKLHREDGPAIEYYSEYEHEDHADYREWYLKGKNYSNSWLFRDEFILSEEPHPKYPKILLFKILKKDKIEEYLLIPGMKE